jgi:hypothetical protein
VANIIGRHPFATPSSAQVARWVRRFVRGAPPSAPVAIGVVVVLGFAIYLVIEWIHPGTFR